MATTSVDETFSMRSAARIPYLEKPPQHDCVSTYLNLGLLYDKNPRNIVTDQSLTQHS